MKLRTRSSLLESLQAELLSRSQCMMGDPSLAAVPTSDSGRGASEGSGGFIENFKVNVGENASISCLTLLVYLHFISLLIESDSSSEPFF